MKEINYMKRIPFKDLNLYDIGNNIRLTGVIYSSRDQHYLVHFEDTQDHLDYTIVDMTHEDWKDFIKQTDLLETEIIQRSNDGKLTKIILRKSVRIIDSRISWKIFERDNYTCRYCGKTGVPLTIDHLILWEEGGPTIEDNLLTACRKCNKQRGNMQYKEWINSKLYKEKCLNIPLELRIENALLVNKIKTIEKVKHIKTR